MKFIYTLPFLITGVLFSQVGIGIDIPSSNQSTLLNVNSSNKGLLAPRVKFTSTDLTSTTIPILSPTEGLIVFNEDASAQVPGYYIFSNGIWNLLSDNSNKTSDLLIYYKNGTTKNFTPTATYTDLDITGLKPNVLINTALADLTAVGNTIKLDKGMYLMTLTINATTTEAATTGIASKAAHVHSYQVKVVTSSGVDISGLIPFEATVSSFANNPKHTLIAKVSFKLPIATDIKLQVARNTTNSTYSGPISYTDASLHFLKAVYK